MRTLITGGAGFIGANLAKRLIEDGYDVSVIDDFSTGDRSNLAGVDVDLVEASILDRRSLREVSDGVDSIVHLAALGSVPRSVKDPLASHHANATGTLEVLEAARAAGNVHTVLASSSSVYGANPTLPKSEELRTRPMSPYAVTKQATESYALAYANVYDLPVLPFRFFNVFGPLQPAGHAYAAVIPAFIDAALRGAPLPVHGDGLQSRDFTYVDSVTNVIADALRRGVSSDDPVNLAFGGRLSLLEVIKLIEGSLNIPLGRTHLGSRPGDVRHSQADQTRLRSLFPDVAEVPVDQGIRATVDWFRSL